MIKPFHGGLLLILAASGGRSAEDPAGGSIGDVDFPCRLEARTRWRDVLDRGRDLTPEDLESLLTLDAEGRNLVREAPGLHVSIWVAAIRMAEDSPVLGEIRRRQEARARGALRGTESVSGWSRAMEIHRACPWSVLAHSVLLDRADAALREGHAGLALRCYADVAARTDDEDLRSRARVGAWIALAQDPADRDLLKASVGRASPAASFPLRGTMLPAAEILERVLGGCDRTPPRHPASRRKPPSSWPRREIIVPEAEPWTIESEAELPLEYRASFAGCVEPASSEGTIVLSGPNLLACFDGSLEEPIWMHRASVPLGFQEDCFPAPAPFAPHVEGGRVYTRWGIERTGGRDVFPRVPMHLAAFDLSDGRPIWTTRGAPGWEELGPISGPAVADGRLYALVVEPHHPAVAAPLVLACLDASTGTLLWTRHLATSCACVRGPAEAGGEFSVDLARFGGSLAVVRGAVYCQTGAGVLARCDARDGTIEWVRGYPRDAATMRPVSVLRRGVGRPLVVGDVVLFLPRDSASLHAVSADTGRVAWEVPRGESRWLLGRCGGKAILAGDDGLLAVEGASGETAWKTILEPLSGRPQLLEGVVYAGSDGAVVAVDGESGEILAKSHCETAGDPRFVIADGVLVVLANR